DRGERRTQFMRERRKEFVLQTIGFFRVLAQVTFTREQCRAFFFGLLASSDVEHEREYRYELTALIVQHRVIPLAIKYRTVFRIVAIMLHAQPLGADALPVSDLGNRVCILIENE